MKIKPRLTYLLTVLFIVNACQKDTTYEEIESLATIENKAETINNGYNLKRANPSNIDLLKNRLKKNHSNLKWSKYQKATNDFWVDDKHVPVVVDSIGNKTYSFLIKSQSKMPTQLFNLIVIERTDGRKIAPFVMEYIFENSDKYSYQISTNRKFNGKINIYSLNTFISIHGLLTSRDDSVQPCYENISTQESSDSTSGGDSSTSTSTSDGTTSGTYSFSPLPVPSEEEVEETLKGVYVPEDGDYCSCYFPAEKGEITVTEDTTTDPDCPTEDVVVAVNAEEDNILDDELIDREKCLFNKLSSNQEQLNLINEILNKFDGDNSEFDILIKSSSLNEGVNGKTSYIKESNLIQIEINHNLNTRPSLYIAKTILHEFIHADMIQSYYSRSGTIENNEFKVLYELYIENVLASNPSVENLDNVTQHEIMADLYVTEMANTLKKFHRMFFNEEVNYLLSSSTQDELDLLYESIAWRGLKDAGVTAFENLSQEEKSMLSDTESKFYAVLTKFCNN